MSKQWVVISTNSADKQAAKLSQHVLLTLHFLFEDSVNKGPALLGWPNYGKLRGVTNVNSANSKPIVEYTWAKLWNARGYNACSIMPRFGHSGILNETQLRHLMALLLDPKSPVNQ